ncbi:tail protein [Paraglaciecola Antarctic JLT virus 2]|nr:tail protein [Paraglaciecola Antarctic JLT virus 2]
MPIKGRDAVDKMIAKNRADSNLKVRGIFFDGMSSVIKPTPVDEGRARNNWFFTTGVPFSLTSSRGKDKEGAGSIASLSSMPKDVLNKKMYLTNNMPYIETLEYGGYPSLVKKGTRNKKTKEFEIRSAGGFSKQAPGGWVRGAVIRMANAIRKL